MNWKQTSWTCNCSTVQIKEKKILSGNCGETNGNIFSLMSNTYLYTVYLSEQKIWGKNKNKSWFIPVDPGIRPSLLSNPRFTALLWHHAR